MKIHWIRIAVSISLCSSCLFAQNAPASPAEYSFTISSQPWTDTGIDFSAGDTLTFTVEAKAGTESSCTTQGAASSAGSPEQLPLTGAPAGALIARTSETGNALLVGNSQELHTDSAGHLFLGINQAAKSDCAFVVKLKITHRIPQNRPHHNEM